MIRTWNPWYAACLLALSAPMRVSWAAAQDSPAVIGSAGYFAALERKITQNPEDLLVRSELVSAYFDYGPNSGLPIEAVREGRRRHITWLIAHHPATPLLESPKALIYPQGGPLADPEGYAEASRLWKSQAAKPGVSTAVIVHAATFFRIADREQAFALCDRIWPASESNPQVARLRATLDVLAILGALSFNNPLELYGDAAAFDSERGRRARDELDGSRNPALVGNAGRLIAQLVHLSFAPTGGGPDIWSAAATWLERAQALEPDNADWSENLVSLALTRALMSPDPSVKATLLGRVRVAATDDFQKARLLLALSQAELAAGDFAACERDARALLNLTEDNRGIRARELMAQQAGSILDQARRKAQTTATGPAGKTANTRITLPAPEMVAPADGAEIDIYPRKTRVSWRPVAGAARYVVQWDYRTQDGWNDESRLPRLTTAEPFAEFDFVGAQPGRWRVWAVGSDGWEGTKSAWRGFRYLR